MADHPPAPRHVLLNREAADRFVQTARVAVPNEACGLVVGWWDDDVLTVERFVATRNRAAGPDEDGGSGQFEIDPQMHLQLQRMLRGSGRSIVGCAHSHLSGPAEPSAVDRANAGEPRFLWLIVSLGDKDLKAWWHESEGRFSPLAIRWMHASDKADALSDGVPASADAAGSDETGGAA
ncbi:proteasome lid subunit RPN8/RPN11 [Rhodothalassium salexigens DSM 2132]|uniref:Proteasome lid subunit RPN8/RPN11 n=1 Tax=Rhodothalassium salexigens DSM 2132 TaxID=1188247 RepID=A0A4R2PS19_RHOSA|nr:M67 family metallopeptidase [Rhodothalassium salexigens]MBB4210716.1 proteasome lid subunit RPN8/RPN11 [Rhodothalassium salexigens DSM 2132]MBK1639875.1 hypothetical protein [Rhodothalassium salexigens DSM 2132]TCP37728.1 proteasome lid subunit RPN8/RPN11 [Rhodothalassium salexigens DSM 2132]